MKPIDANERTEANVFTADYVPYVYPDGVALGDAILQLDSSKPLGLGFHIYRMPAGMTTRAHRHSGVEQFLVLEGTLVDSDGKVFRKGDMACYRDGSEHDSFTPDGCLLAVYITDTEVNL